MEKSKFKLETRRLTISFPGDLLVLLTRCPIYLVDMAVRGSSHFDEFDSLGLRMGLLGSSFIEDSHMLLV